MPAPYLSRAVNSFVFILYIKHTCVKFNRRKTCLTEMKLIPMRTVTTNDLSEKKSETCT